MRKRKKGDRRMQRWDPTSRAQVVVAALTAVTAIAGCAAQFAR
ncbi:hypothetical protein [Streptomyces sp. NPDC001137]